MLTPLIPRIDCAPVPDISQQAIEELRNRKLFLMEALKVSLKEIVASTIFICGRIEKNAYLSKRSNAANKNVKVVVVVAVVEYLSRLKKTQFRYEKKDELKDRSNI
uniref:Uncharacterized protein n=1 Tax=Glossina austeni TaxID=7395 RepID=A0A1A9VAQ1_GLOAU